MKKFLVTLLILITSLFGELKNEYLTQKILDSKIPIVDIRTVGEWKETGILEGSIPIEFFNEKGKYNIPAFLTELNNKVDTTKPFALICRTGSRTDLLQDCFKFCIPLDYLLGECHDACKLRTLR